MNYLPTPPTTHPTISGVSLFPSESFFTGVVVAEVTEELLVTEEVVDCVSLEVGSTGGVEAGGGGVAEEEGGGAELGGTEGFKVESDFDGTGLETDGIGGTVVVGLTEEEGFGSTGSLGSTT